MLGAYGPWAASLHGEGPRPLSFRAPRWTDIDEWRKQARGALVDLLRSPEGTRAIDVQVHDAHGHDGLDVQELSWQLPYGPRTHAYFLKPWGAHGRLPGVLAFHDHGGDKYFGKRKITRAGDDVHPAMVRHQTQYYGGVPWANELARRGFAVLVHDVFPFESRRILASDLPRLVVERLMSPPLKVRELTPEDLAAAAADTAAAAARPVFRDDRGADVDVPEGEPEDRIIAYNAFAAQHESVIAKSLFSAGLTWPGLMVAEDLAALDYLASRPDVDPERLGCGGLSGGGLRTSFLAGLDDRIRCAVCAGMMTTWEDFLLATSYTHTWMIYVPGLPALLDYPEIIGLRTPRPTLVLATTEDPLFTRQRTERAARILEEIYAKAGVAERFRFSRYPGPHKLDRPMQEEAFAWMERWLS